MTEICIKRYIRDCRDCPNVCWEKSKKGLYYDCYCTNGGDKKLVDDMCLGVGEKTPTIPSWCPCSMKQGFVEES